MAGRQSGSGPVKISIVGGGQRGSKVWRRERIEMTNDPDLDDCAFLSGKIRFIMYNELFQILNKLFMQLNKITINCKRQY